MHFASIFAFEGANACAASGDADGDGGDGASGASDENYDKGNGE